MSIRQQVHNEWTYNGRGFTDTELTEEVRLRAARAAECRFETSDGNRDDPSYAYCGHPKNHAGDHGNWRR
jgi:hypothetical protein